MNFFGNTSSGAAEEGFQSKAPASGIGTNKGFL